MSKTTRAHRGGKSAKMPNKVMKRDGTVVDFDLGRIVEAVNKALEVSLEGGINEARYVARGVVKELVEMTRNEIGFVPHVEDIQDLVESELMMMNLVKTAKAYILYRDKHANLRRMGGVVSEEVKGLVREGRKYFSNRLSEFAYYSFYSKWISGKGRRETWLETVDRYVNFMKERVGSKFSKAEYDEIRDYMLGMKAMGSMRLLWAAGDACRASDVCAYNCSFISPSKWQDFGEIMYILMCGTGVGFSAERQNVEMLPIIKRQTGIKLPNHIIADSKEGWADAFVLGLKTWSDGSDVEFDYSRIRPQGSRLKTMGGRASGPEPLKNLLDFSRERMMKRQGRHLTTLDVHDIICKTGEVVVMGGVRRSALISISDLDDSDMASAKNGQFYLSHPERSMANNSAVYNEKPTMLQFMDEWSNLMKSGSGERGIFNRGGLKKQLPERRWDTFKKHHETCGTNPCGEIVLRSKQFCNLSEVVARQDDTEDSLLNKVRIATMLGTYQASLTNFQYLSKEWKKNCEEEALLGVSITGQWDSKVVVKKDVLIKLKNMAIKTNIKYAKRLGIKPSTCITCVKPSGNGSTLFDSSSGMHPRHAPYYIRRVRVENHNPIFMMLRDMGMPYYPEVGQDKENARTYVIEFPIKSPSGVPTKNDLDAIMQLEHWKLLKENFTEHNPSVTISIADHEWMSVGAWVYQNWDIVGGLSFLPKSDHVYRLAPYEEIDKERYDEMVSKLPDIDFSKLVLYEYDDVTAGSKELACVAGVCEADAVVTPISSPSESNEV